MASFTSTVTACPSCNIEGEPRQFAAVHRWRRGRPPDPGSPDYRTRLRRARLGLAVALTPILMLFVSFTSAYIVRQGLPTLDPNTNQVVHDWPPVPLPTVLFLINTCVLLLSSVTMEFARRQLIRRVALRQSNQFPECRWAPNENFLGLARPSCLESASWPDNGWHGESLAIVASSSPLTRAVHLFIC